MKYSLVILVLMLAGQSAFGQSVLSARFQELQRVKQLAKGDQPKEGLMVNAYQRYIGQHDSGSSEASTRIGKAAISVLPISTTFQHNSQLPYEWNLGAMIPARGLQVLATAGLQIEWPSGVSLQLAPESVIAENRNFETYSQELNAKVWRDRFLYDYNVTDMPDRMAGGQFRRFHPGQSALSYSRSGFVYSISTKNKWWGPGYRNALIMSSNAPGFLHLSAATKKPLATGWGAIEGEIIGGVLESSGQQPPRPFSAYEGQFVYTRKSNEARYINGLTLTWAPKWVKGLFVGIAKSSVLYWSDITTPLDILPLQGFAGTKITSSEKKEKKLSQGSLFARFVLPEEHAEVYLEYGKKGGALLPWKLITGKPYRSAFVVGLRKLLPLGSTGSFVEFGAEITQLQASESEFIMQPDSWYTHNHVRQGYTNLGKSLGAGIGPGSNAQTFELNWVKGDNRIGIQLERVKHNADFYYAAFTYLGDYRRHWITMAGTLKADWSFGNWSMHGSVGMIRSLNHQWIVIEANPSNFFSAGNDYLNVASQLSLRYKL